jgi:2-haloacid dehalogenase
MATGQPAYKALTFDTGGTILDWHGGLVRTLRDVGRRRRIEADWGEVANEYRRRSLGTIVNQIGPRFNFDDVHRDQLDRVLDAKGLGAFDAADRHEIWRTWFELDAWPDFPPALKRLRTRYPCVCVISCEMLGVYKTRPEAYQATAKLLQLAPADILMVACHNFDLDAARREGFKTCFVKRPDEWGPAGPPDPTPNPACDLVVDEFGELAAKLGC